MVSVRRASFEDFEQIRNCNLWCLPENYNSKYFYYHFLSWDHLLYVAEDTRGKIVGYVLAKSDDELEQDKEPHGHITSLSVLRSHRRLGIANQLMTATHDDMKNIYGAKFCSLHVRVTNRAAFSLYKEKLGYMIYDLEKGYYNDGEDAYSMRKYFNDADIPKDTPYLQQLLEEAKEAQALASAQPQ